MIQATLGFATDQGQRTGAWDEVYYTDHVSPIAALNAWTGANGSLLVAAALGGIFSPGTPLGRRLGALSDSCYLYYGRFSDPDDKTTKAIIYRPNGGKVDGYRPSDNIAQDCASMRCLTTNGYQREVRIGGLPDYVAAGGTIDPGFVSSYIGDTTGANIDPTSTNNFLNAWASIGGSLRVRQTTIGGSSSWKILGFLKPDQYGPLQVKLDTTVSSPDTTKSYDMSIRGQPQLRGKWLLSQISSGLYNLIGSERVSAPTIINGYLTARQWIPVAISLARSLFASAHKLGKKKYQYRGRRSPILLRH